MRVADQLNPPAAAAEAEDWAEQTRRVLTRDLLVRAAYAAPGEARALEFRALHLNLPVIDEIAARLDLDERQLAEAEHDALDGLLEAVRAFDPYGEQEFTDLATTRVRERLERHCVDGPTLPRRRPVRLAVHRVALAVAGYRVV
ncbi:MAG TPA: hypothetical protein VHR35_05950 [Nocardioides sp.]|jgi:hypothetical protein|nr:hypothetical protein [Nocardioides sp.]